MLFVSRWYICCSAPVLDSDARTPIITPNATLPPASFSRVSYRHRSRGNRECSDDEGSRSGSAITVGVPLLGGGSSAEDQCYVTGESAGVVCLTCVRAACRPLV